LRGRSYAVSDSARPACRPEAESLSASVGFSAPRGVYERDFASPAQRANLFDFAGSYTIGNVGYLRTADEKQSLQIASTHPAYAQGGGSRSATRSGVGGVWPFLNDGRIEID
jgi:hypothetical protein